MQLREVLDVLVLPHSFRNIDFSHRGVYTLSFRVHTKVSQPDGTHQTICAFPQLLCLPTATQHHQHCNSLTILQTSEYRTRSFYISFNDESVFFDTGCLFRIEIEVSKELQTEIFLQCFLLHRDMQHLDIQHLDTINPSEFMLRSVKVLRLNSKQRELTYHGEIIFNSIDFFSVIETSVVMQRVDYQLRMHSYQLTEFCLLKQQKKREFSKTQQLFRLLPHEEGLAEVHKQLNKFPLRELFDLLVTNQINLYHKLLKNYESCLEDISISEKEEFLKGQPYKPKKMDNLITTLPLDSNLALVSLQKRYETQDSQEIRLLIVNQCNQISRNIRYVWLNVFSLVQTTYRRNYNKLKSAQQKQRHATFQTTYFRNVTAERNKEIERFKATADKVEGILPVGYKYPLIFGPQLPFQDREEGEVLTVFVHGFQGSELDLELVKNYIQAYFRQSSCLLINSLEDETSSNIQLLGQKFAREVERYILKSAFEFSRINFVGYSLGGVIIRAGMRHLAAYKDKVNLLITLASPHLGIHRMDNFLVSAGVWYMIRFDKVKSLNQLNYTDDNNLLMKLSKDPSIGWFRKIILASSKEDNFVPNHSARIEPHDKDPFAMQAYNNIVKLAKDIYRVDVWFDSEAGTIDKMLGRKSHIDFLEAQGFSQIFFSMLCNYL